MHRQDKAPAIPSFLCLLSRLPREVCDAPVSFTWLTFHCRVKIVTIRDYGLYPCTRCLIPKEEIFKLGREEDRRIRKESRRVDTVERQGRVDQARKNLYKDGYALSGEYVDGFLKDGSLVPTKVRPL